MLLLPVHIAAGCLGIVTGFVALFTHKGGRAHRKAGAIFVGAMVVMASTGVVMSAIKGNGGNIMGGSVAIYMVTTALLTVRRPALGVDGKDVAALLLALGIAVTGLVFGLDAMHAANGRKFGYGPPLYFIFGGGTLLAGLGDVRMLLARGIHGTPRIARHLWRMCVGLFIATGSFFIGQAKVFPKPIRIMPLLVSPVLLVVVLLFYWLVRVRVSRAYRSGEPSLSKGLGASIGRV